MRSPKLTYINIGNVECNKYNDIIDGTNIQSTNQYNKGDAAVNTDVMNIVLSNIRIYFVIPRHDSLSLVIISPPKKKAA